MTEKRFFAGLWASCAAIAIAPPALAQTPPAGAEEIEGNETDQSGFGDIIVTAQRRDEGLSKVPVAVTVLSSDALAAGQINSEQELRAAAPGLAVRPTLNSNQLNYSLRGQSLDAFSQSVPSVLPYINEVQIGSTTGGATAFYDLQSVQVLKGPQGTLFGRSATGGAVLFTTAKPTEELSGYASATIGNYDNVQLEGAVSGPLVGEHLLARVSGFFQKRDGFQKNLFTGRRNGDVERYAFRGSLSAVFDNFRNELVVDYLNNDSGNVTGVLSGFAPLAGGNFAPGIPVSLLYAGNATPTQQIAGQCTVQAFIGGGACPPVLPAVAAYYSAYYSDPRRNPNGILGEFADQQARGPYVVSSDQPDFYKSENIIVTDNTVFDLSDTVTLKNIFGYVHIDSFTSFDGDGSPFVVFQNGKFDEPERGFKDVTEQISNELQLQGSAFGDRLDFTTGVFYQRNTVNSPHNASFFDILFGGQRSDSQYRVEDTTWAGYLQGTLKLNENGLSITAGTRYTSEKVRLLTLPTDTVRQTLGDPAPAGFSYDQSETYNSFNWQFGIQNQISPELLIYAVTRRANKAGGYNGTVPPRVGTAISGGNRFDGQKATDVEVGAKFNGRLGSMPTRLSIAGFYIWDRDSQRTAYGLVAGAPTTLTVNVPKGRTYGLEFEGQVRPADWLTLGATYNYTNARYLDGNVVVAGQPQLFDQVPDTPKSSGIAYADVSIPLSSATNLELHGDVYAQSRSTISPQSVNNYGSTMKGYALANFRIGLDFPDTGINVTASLKNAFDKIYYAGGIPLAPLAQYNLLVPGNPREFALTVRAKF